MMINIITDRLLLRCLRIDDVTDDYVNWLNDPDVNKYLSCANSRQTLNACRDYVQSFQGSNDKALVGIFLKDNGLHIGNITLLPPIDWSNKVGTIGISIGRKEYWSKGFARESLLVLVAYCFESLKLHRLQSGVHASNTRSLKLFITCGFKIEGLMREESIINGKYEDGYLVSLLEGDYHKTQADDCTVV
jgi:[ribosomal protein S5]-alanine N-acetyltransferase